MGLKTIKLISIVAIVAAVATLSACDEDDKNRQYQSTVSEAETTLQELVVMEAPSYAPTPYKAAKRNLRIGKKEFAANNLVGAQQNLDAFTANAAKAKSDTIAAKRRSDISDHNGSAVEPTTKRYRVKRGDSLWKIARRSRFKSGFAWVKIYAANKSKIRNPHRIYPGQVLVIR